MATIRVHTAQNVTLEYEVASIGDRIVAVLVDYLVLIAWGAAWGLLLTTIAAKNTGPHKDIDYHTPASIIAIVFLVFLASPYVFYNLLCEVFLNGQSIGKKARGIKVMRLDGTPARLGDYLMRWLLRLIDFQFMGLVAIITIATNGRGQRLGDLAAGTTVVNINARPPQATLLAPALATMANYQVVFPQAALLADHDVALVRQLANQANARGNFELLNEVANKVKAITGIQTDLQDLPFLQTVLRDHAHLARQ